jgi:aspartyl-tRNA(Asn)/glutamyl-tRNA(Gln) amidotransferase subunit B
VTVIQRRKEEAEDYRYFPDPDLVPVVVDAAWIDRTRADMGELPATARQRLQDQHKLSAYDAGVITQQGRGFVRYFEEVARSCGDAKEASNWTTNQVLATLNERKIAIEAFPLPSTALGDLIRRARDMGLNAQRTREVFARMLQTGEDAQAAIDALGFKVVADEGQLREIVRQAIADNAKAVADYKKGKTKAADAIKGAVMRQTRGMAKVELVQQLLLEELEKM